MPCLGAPAAATDIATPRIQEASLLAYRAGYRVKTAIDGPARIGLLDKMKLKKCAPISGKPAIGVFGFPRPRRSR